MKHTFLFRFSLKQRALNLLRLFSFPVFYMRQIEFIPSKSLYFFQKTFLGTSVNGLLLLLSLLGFSACSLFKTPPIPPIYLKEINFSLDSVANANSATAIDLLIIYDADLLKVLLKMDAKTYFTASKQIRQDYPDLVDILHWELTPGQVIKNYPIDLRSDAPEGALLFANYYAPGPQRIRIGSSKIIHVRLRPSDFCITEQGCFGAQTLGVSPKVAAMEKSFSFAKIKKTNPQTYSAEIEAEKSGSELAKKVAKQAAKFSVKH